MEVCSPPRTLLNFHTIQAPGVRRFS